MDRMKNNVKLWQLPSQGICQTFLKTYASC